MKVEIVEIDLNLVDHCPWNPRGEITPESVADLTASIREKGVLQEPGIMRQPENPGRYWAIYGNRRLVAADRAGFMRMRFKLYTELTEADAREITRVENEVRLGIDPLEDAKLLDSCLKGGRTYEDVALMFGVSPATVCRRVKLLDLDESILKIVKEQPGKLATNALEHIASYPKEIQAKAAPEINSTVKYHDGVTAWGNIAYKITSHTVNLDRMAFVEGGCGKDCAVCLNRTGAQPTLFGELCAGDELGDCLDPACMKRRKDEWVKRELERLIPSACAERVKVQYLHNVPDPSAEYSKKHPCAYYSVSEYDGGVKVKFGASKKAESARRKEEKAAREADEKALVTKIDRLEEKLHDLFVADDGARAKAAIGRFFAKTKGGGGLTACERFLVAVMSVKPDCGLFEDPFDLVAAKKSPGKSFADIFLPSLRNDAELFFRYGGDKCVVVRFLETFDCSDTFTREDVADLKGFAEI